MLTVHHLGQSQSDRIVWLCEELGIDYEFKRYDRDPATRLAPAVYKALHPSGTAPVITDGDVTLAETGAIFDYILAKYDNRRLVVAADQPHFADYLYWLHFGNGSLVPTGMMALVLGRGQVAAENPIHLFVKGRADAAYAQIESRLAQVPFFAGEELTAADIMMVFPLLSMGGLMQPSLAPFPQLQAYLERIKGLEGYQRAMTKAEPATA